MTALVIVGAVLILLTISGVVALLPRVFGPRVDHQLHDPHQWPEDNDGD